MDPKDHILIVDDDRELRELLVRYLEKNEFSVTAVKDGREMRQALAAKPIDLIVLDLMLPQEDGLKLCRDLRAQGSASPPILMLTARGDEADRILGLEMGADDYLIMAARSLWSSCFSVERCSAWSPLVVPHLDGMRAGDPIPA
jgi:two-component system OmpR family response regulator